jgi:DNA-binding NarL/FixJ family response regulator
MVGLDNGASGGAGPGDGAPVRVLICDDHEVLRHGLRTVLRWAPEIVVVAETGDADEALALAGRLSPDVTLVGLGARGPVVQDLVAALTGLGVRVILLGQADADGDVVDALRAGARGYVHSTASPERLLDGVRAVAHGETVLDAAVANELLHRLDNGHRRGAEPQPAPSLLTARQQAVSALVAEGLTNAEIADRLQVSKATVKGHITVALRRLGLRDRTQLAIYVHRSVRPEPDRAEDPLSG